jgi:alkylation response protein AidB-like acyl-CoA dehydrogenase
MDLRLTEKQEALRDEVRTWVESEVPEEYDGWDEYPDAKWVAFDREFHKKVAAKGWLTMDWPKEYGGGKYGVVEQAIIHRELNYRRAPIRMHLVGVYYVAPCLFEFGTDEQRARFLPGIKNGTETWSNALTEAEAGSDLANLRTTAELKDGEWVVNGEKTLNTRAYYCDYFWTAVRTSRNASRYHGISVLMIERDRPGIEVLTNMAINGHQLSTIRFNDVRVPQENLAGPIDTAWREALTPTALLAGLVSGNLRFRRLFDDVVRCIKSSDALTRMVREDGGFRRMLAQIKVELDVQESLYWRRVSALAHEGPTYGVGKRTRGGVHDVAGAASSLWDKDWGPGVVESLMDIVGRAGFLSEDDPEWGRLSSRIGRVYMEYRASHVHGTPDILRNVIAYRALGLPRS